MKSNKISNYLILVLFFLTYTLNTNAQTKKIGIVFNANTNIIHIKVGGFKKTSYTHFILDLKIEQYIKDRLTDYLTPQFSVEICELPNELQKSGLELYQYDVDKKLKNWANKQKDKYDIIIFAQNLRLPIDGGSNILAEGSGIRTIALKSSLYSSISYYAYDTHTSKIEKYNNKGGLFWYPLEGVKYPKKVSSDFLLYITYELKRHLAGRIEYFLIESKIMTEDEVTTKANIIYQDKNIPRPRATIVVENPFNDDIY